MRRVAVLVVCAACGRLDFDVLGDAGSGDSGDDTTATCTSWGPFSTPVHVSQLASAVFDFAPAISEDDRLIVFDSTRLSGTDYDLWQATRSYPSAPFSTPTRLDTISMTGVSDNTPTLSPDGNTIYFSSNRSGIDALLVATRADTTQPFGTAVPMAGPISTLKACCPSLSYDQRTIYFAVLVGGYDIYVATRPDIASDFGAPAELTVLSTTATDWSPAISRDGLELFFESDRGPAFQADLYVTRRASRALPFGPPQLVSELASSMYAVGDPALSADGTTLWFSISDAPDTVGASDIYYATRACL